MAGSALAFSVIYFASDVIEAAQGGTSDFQLALTLVAEIAVPFFVIALYLVQRPAIGRLGRRNGSVGYPIGPLRPAGMSANSSDLSERVGA